jgi:hypothetical protein
MQHRTLTTLTLVSILALAGCNGEKSPEQLLKQQVSHMEELSAALAKATDKASAEKQKPAVEAAIAKMKASQKEMEALPADKQKEGEALADKLGSELQAAMSKMAAEGTRISQNAELDGVLGPVLDKLGE